VTARARLALAVMALLALVAFVYRPVARGVFIWDDVPLVVGNRLGERGSLKEIFTQPFAPVNPLTDSRPVYYRPLTVASLRGDYGLASFDARSYHMTNLLLHLCATMTLLLAARRFGAPPFAAVTAALAWALFPRSTECVAWISGRADLIAALFSIAALGLWPWFGDDESTTSPRSARTRAALAAAAVLCSLLAKEVAAAAVLAIAVGTMLGARGLGRERRKLVLERLACLVPPLAIYGALRWAATRSVSSYIAPMGAGPRAQTVLEAIGRYVEMTLDAWHPTTTIGLLGDVDAARAVAGALTLLGCAVVAVLALRRTRLAAKGDEAGAPGKPRDPRAVAVAATATLGIASLALVVHVVPIVLVSAVAADRLLYLPLAGLAMSLAVASAKLTPRGRKVAAGAVLALTATFMPVTRARATDYTDDIRFRVAAAEQAHPHNTAAKSALANVLRADAEFDLACRLHASAGRTLADLGAPAAPRYVRALENLGGCYEMLGDYDAAAQVYRRLIAIRPDDARVHMAIGFLFMHAYALDDAETSLKRALALDATLEPAKSTLAALPTTRAQLARFASLEAREADRLGWARLLSRLGRVPDATKAWLRLALDPKVSDDTAYRGVEFVIANGDIASARLAAEAYARRDATDEQLARENFVRRARDQASIDGLRPRIEALAEQ
jgi:tetratricopeptide (TPR) repeat protein